MPSVTPSANRPTGNAALPMTLRNDVVRKAPKKTKVLAANAVDQSLWSGPVARWSEW